MSDEPDDRDDHEPSERPMGVAAAFGWGGVAWFFAIMVLDLSRSVRPGLRLDIVNNEVCVALGFSVATALAVWVHLPERSLGDALGLRPVSPLLVVLAALIGASLQVPVTLLSTAIETRWPRGQEELELLAQLFTVRPGPYRIAFAACTVALGPLVEELLFRGIVFRALYRHQVRVVVMLGTAGLFALIHLDPRKLGPIFLAGLILGLLRERAGSVGASLAGHMSFNAVTTFALLVGWSKMAEPTTTVPPLVAVVGTVLLTVLLIAYVKLAERSPVAAAAREADAT